MRQAIRTSFTMMILFTVFTGLCYPLAITGLAQAVFPAQAAGSLISQKDQPIGSRLIGQIFTSPAYFHSRPSAAGSDGYDAASSAGSNLGPTSDKLKANAQKAADSIQEENNLPASTLIPSDLVLASGSGLDPHITPTAAYIQVARVAKARNLPPETVQSLVVQHTEPPQFGLLGRARVNVLELNLALDQLTP